MLGRKASAETNRKKSENSARYWLGKKRPDLSIKYRGKPRTKEDKERISRTCKAKMDDNKLMRLKELAKLGARKRWKGHIKIKRKYTYQYKYHKNNLEKKRFTNQRYKARKRNALGSHTFEEWQLLKEFYKYMCLCCKQTEPNIKLTEDHIIPLSKGGSDYIENIQPLCTSCNTKKFTKYINYRGGEQNFLFN